MNSPLHLPPILGIGAGGHCKVVMEIIRRTGTWRIAGLLDSDPTRKGNNIGDVAILGSDDLAATLFDQGIQAAFLGIGSIGPSGPRRRIFAALKRIGFAFPVLVHPSASLAFDTNIANGTCIMPGAIVNPGTNIGECAIINSGAIVEHDCDISNFVHIAPGAVLGGSVSVGEGSHIGLGARVRQGIRIGRDVLIGAGAVVVKDVPDGCTVIGIPARVQS